jgi:hypothetical protein
MLAIKQQRHYSYGSSSDLKVKREVSDLTVVQPDIETDLLNHLKSTVDIIVTSLDRILRVEYCNLFRLPSGMTPMFLSNVKTQEVLVERAKSRLEKVVRANSFGPKL